MSARFDSVAEADHQRELLQRHAAKITLHPNGCWIWTGAIGGGGQGYGLLTYRRVVFRAHRFIYEWLVGPIPDDLELDHTCRTTSCVNPAHLEPVTHAENIRRHHAQQTCCVRGHEFTTENTRWRKDRPASRECRSCGRQKQIERHRTARK